MLQRFLLPRLEVREQELWNERERSLNEQRLRPGGTVAPPYFAFASQCPGDSWQKWRLRGSCFWTKIKTAGGMITGSMRRRSVFFASGCRGLPRGDKAFAALKPPTTNMATKRLRMTSAHAMCLPRGRRALKTSWSGRPAVRKAFAWMYLDVVHFLSLSGWRKGGVGLSVLPACCLAEQDAQGEEQHVDDGQAWSPDSRWKPS